MRYGHRSWRIFPSHSGSSGGSGVGTSGVKSEMGQYLDRVHQMHDLKIKIKP